jgi:hypothetical protein
LRLFWRACWPLRRPWLRANQLCQMPRPLWRQPGPSPRGVRDFNMQVPPALPHHAGRADPPLLPGLPRSAGPKGALASYRQRLCSPAGGPQGGSAWMRSRFSASWRD